MKSRGLLAVLFLFLCGLIAAAPLILIRDSEFSGADGQAQELIGQLAPDYEPWAESVIAPPGGETESLLFCIQAGIGCGVLGFGFGYLVARKKYRKGDD